MKRRVLAWLLSLMLVVTLIPEFSFAEGNKQVTADNVTKDDVSAKTEDTTTYKLSDGSNMTVFHAENVRFEDENGNLVDYDPVLVRIGETASLNGTGLTDYAYENKTGDSKQYMPKRLSEDTPLLMEKEGKDISFSMTDETLKQFGLLNEQVGVEKNAIENAYEEEIKAKVNASYESDNGQTKVVYTSEANGVKESIILNSIPRSNVFTYRMNLTGMYPVKNEDIGSIVFF